MNSIKHEYGSMGMWQGDQKLFISTYLKKEYSYQEPASNQGKEQTEENAEKLCDRGCERTRRG